jgi:hypothetical protein
MADAQTETPPVFVVKFRGGIAGGVFRLALGRVAASIRIERGGKTQAYEYAGPEDQVEHSYAYDKATRNNVRVSRVAAVYHIFRPVEQ